MYNVCYLIDEMWEKNGLLVWCLYVINMIGIFFYFIIIWLKRVYFFLWCCGLILYFLFLKIYKKVNKNIMFKYGWLKCIRNSNL